LERHKKKGILVIVSVIAIVIVVSIAATVLYIDSLPDFPRWEGLGDWEACSQVASASPEDALRTASQNFGYTRLDLTHKHATIMPKYIDDTGIRYELTCTGGINIGEAEDQAPFASPNLSNAWETIFYDDYTFCLEFAWIEWETGHYFSVSGRRC